MEGKPNFQNFDARTRMPRRHLRLVSSSSSGDDAYADADELQIPRNPNPTTPSQPLEISDEDFVDVPDAFSPPSPPPLSPPPSSAAERRVDEFLRRMGLALRAEWLDSCLSVLAGAVHGFEAFDVAAKARACFEEFLRSDMSCSGAGVLPEGVGSMHKAELEGPFVVQVDEIVNISNPLRERYRDASAGFKRCLKLSMTDGRQQIFGMEYRPIKELEVLAPAGFKILLRNVHIRRGLIMLVPEVLEVLGGQVDELDAARRRLVDEVNKPPRGRGNKPILPLPQRATLAAWPSTTINHSSQADNSIPESVPIPQPVAPVNPAIVEGGTGERIMEENDEPLNRRNTTEEFDVPRTVEDAAEEVSMTSAGGSTTKVHASAETSPATKPRTDFSTHFGTDNTHEVARAEHPLILSGDREIPFTYLASLLARWAAEKDRTPIIQGKIKCFLTGVKAFQFKERSSFELYVYIDDGSLISEVLIDHHVVHKGIGHSPEEVTAALSSADRRLVTDMRETLKRFQHFLAKFEGTMVVQFTENSSVPVALEMNQGCPTSDAWLLLRRLKIFTAPQSSSASNFDPIELSP